MALKIEMLRCFCIVAQTGNLTEAATRLGRTQSAISMTLRQFEDHLGKKLFEGERKNRLSPVGERVFELAQRQVRLFDQTVQNIEAAAMAEHGLVRIVAVPSVGALIFPSLLDHMTDRFPGLKIELRDTDTQQVLDAIAEDRADVGIASGRHALNGIETMPLFEDAFGLVAASDHPLITSKKPPTPEDILSVPFVRNTLCDLIDNPRFRPAIEGAEVTIHNTHSLITMVGTGRWITLLPKTVARFVPETVSFRSIPDLSTTRKVYLYTRKRPQFPNPVQVCQEFILEGRY